MRTGDGIGRFDEDLVAPLAGVARPADHNRCTEEHSRHVAEVRQVPDAGHASLDQHLHRVGTLQAEVMQVVVEQQRAVAPHRRGDEELVASAAAVDHHPGVGAHSKQHNVLHKHAPLVEHARVLGLARQDLGAVAGDQRVQHRRRVGTHHVELLQPGHVLRSKLASRQGPGWEGHHSAGPGSSALSWAHHKPALRADSHVRLLDGRIVGIHPRCGRTRVRGASSRAQCARSGAPLSGACVRTRAHAVPVL